MATDQHHRDTQNIAHHLAAHNITAHDVADFLGITTAEAADHISGRNPWPMDLLYTLAVHTGMTPETIYADA